MRVHAVSLAILTHVVAAEGVTGRLGGKAQECGHAVEVDISSVQQQDHSRCELAEAAWQELSRSRQRHPRSASVSSG